MKGVTSAFSQIVDGKKGIETNQNDMKVMSEIIEGWDELLKRLDDGWEVDQEMDRNLFLVKKHTRHG
jgi:hypothetical protein